MAAQPGEDDLAAVMRWLGETSAAGWRVTAHIPQTQLALVVSTVNKEEEDPTAMTHMIIEQLGADFARATDNDTDSGESSSEGEDQEQQADRV